MWFVKFIPRDSFIVVIVVIKLLSLLKLQFLTCFTEIVYRNETDYSILILNLVTSIIIIIICRLFWDFYVHNLM